LYEADATMEAIAQMLGVTHSCISKDLVEFVPRNKSKVHTKTKTNPKAAADIANVLTFDEARRIAVNVAKLPGL
jgi:hypothetical protein